MATLDELIAQYRALEQDGEENQLTNAQKALIGLAPIAAGAIGGALTGEPGGLGLGLAAGGQAGVKALETIREEEKERRKFGKELGLKSAELTAKQAEREQDRLMKERDLALKAREVAVKEGEGTKGGKIITGSETKGLADLDTAENQLNDIMMGIEKNAAIMGPVRGKISTINPFATDARVFDAQMKLAAQNIGVSLEGGKLTDEDIGRYRKMLPNIDDTPDVAKGKIDLVRGMIQARRQSAISNLQKAGYGVSGFQPQRQPQAMPQSVRGAEAAAMQPQRVRQNGVVFQLNPKTGQYEPVGQ
jgi:hypothetical protein